MLTESHISAKAWTWSHTERPPPTEAAETSELRRDVRRQSGALQWRSSEETLWQRDRRSSTHRASAPTMCSAFPSPLLRLLRFVYTRLFVFRRRGREIAMEEADAKL